MVSPTNGDIQPAASPRPLLFGRPRTKLALRIVILTLIGAAFFIFRGLSSPLTPWSQATINAIVKYRYPATGQRETTVLLFREENLQHLKTSYPVPYGMHTQVLEALSTYSPRVVFIDFAFIDQREGEDVRGLADAICMLREAGATAFLAAPALGEGGGAVRSELLRCAKPAAPEMEGSIGFSGVLTYSNGHQRDSHFIPSAAFAAASDTLRLEPAKEAPLEIVWGKGIAPLNRKWMNCSELAPFEAIKSMLLHGPLAAKLACPYTRTITVGHLLNSSGDADIRDALHGRVVFYGAGFRLTGDRVDSPVYAEMPGVYLHAMAYDNLATLGQNYKRAVRQGPIALAFDAVLLIVAAWLLVTCPPTSPAEKLEQFVDKIGWGIVAVLLTALIFFAATWVDGPDFGLLLLVGGYCVLYRPIVAKDYGFLYLTLITFFTALIGYSVLNMGPRNVLAFLAFFAAVRYAQKHLKEAAKRYFDLKDRKGQAGGLEVAAHSSNFHCHDDGPVGRLRRFTGALLDGFFRLFGAEAGAKSDSR
jgi:CHASE2 domain-containing sensor protein